MVNTKIRLNIFFGPECPVSCIEPGLAIYFTYGNIHVSVLFSQIIPPSPSPTESKSLFFTLCLFCCLAVRYDKWHRPIYKISFDSKGLRNVPKRIRYLSLFSETMKDSGGCCYKGQRHGKYSGKLNVEKGAKRWIWRNRQDPISGHI